METTQQPGSSPVLEVAGTAGPFPTSDCESLAKAVAGVGQVPRGTRDSCVAAPHAHQQPFSSSPLLFLPLLVVFLFSTSPGAMLPWSFLHLMKNLLWFFTFLFKTWLHSRNPSREVSVQLQFPESCGLSPIQASSPVTHLVLQCLISLPCAAILFVSWV